VITDLRLTPVAFVVGGRSDPIDDDWGDVQAVIRFDAARFEPQALAGLDAFSHLEVVYVFDRADPAATETGSRHPRGRADWPKVGIFAQRGKDRPNHLGVSRCRLLGVDGLDVHVQALDAIAATPVLDVKPWMAEFGPIGEHRQPSWATELMAGYWRS
jgi:tRNA (Thr-GGU) A37 N-methylase